MPFLVLLPNDPVFTVVAASDAYVALVGVDRMNLVGKGIFEIFADSGAQASLQMSLRGVIASGLADQLPGQKYCVDSGSGVLERYWKALNKPVKGPQGVAYVVHMVEDTTETFKADRRSQDSEAMFRQAVDSMPQLVWSALPDGTVDLYSRQCLEFAGMTEEEAMLRGWRAVVHPDEVAMVAERWAHSVRTGDLFEAEYRCRRYDGEYRWILSRASAIRDPEGRIARWFGTGTDIHDQKESEAALRKANRELEEFAYVASHDLQEPLRMVNIYTQLMLMELEVRNEKLENYAAFVQQGVRRMSTLIQDLLAFSRTVHADERPDGTADLAASFADALSTLSSKIAESDAMIAAQALPTVRGDTKQMSQVFQNLLSNALKYRRWGIRPEIQVCVERKGAEWVISVEDNGIGFESRYAERIFGLFKRLHKDEYPGTGLGLAICRRIVERTGGRMWAQGIPGEGARFFVALEALTDDETATAPPVRS